MKQSEVMAAARAVRAEYKHQRAQMERAQKLRAKAQALVDEAREIEHQLQEGGYSPSWDNLQKAIMA